MSYLDTMYEGLFKEAAPWGNTFGNTFKNENTGAAPEQKPEPPKPMAVPAAQQNQPPAPEPKPQNQFAPQAAPRALTAEEQGIKPQAAPRALTWMEQQQNKQTPAQPNLAPQQDAKSLYEGMPQTPEDWQRNQQENYDLWNLPGEQVVGNDVIGGTGDEVAGPAVNPVQPTAPVQPQNNPPQNPRAIAEQKYLRGEQLTPEESKLLGTPATHAADGSGTPVSNPAPPTTTSEDLMQRVSQPGTASAEDYTNFGTQYGVNYEFLASDAFRKDMSDEQRIAYLSAAIAKDVRDFSEANGTVGDWVDTKMNGVIDKVDEFLTGADDGLSNFIKSTFFGMEISPEGSAEAQAGLDARTQARQDALKTRFLNKYLASKHGQAVVDKVLDAAPLSTVKQMVDTMKNQTGSVKLSDQATQMLENKVRQKCYNAMSEDFFGNLPQVASLWFKSKGWDTLSGWAENPWVFYSGLIALLLGGGALIGGGLGLFGGGGGGGSTVVVQQSPQDSYRQNLYRTF